MSYMLTNLQVMKHKTADGQVIDYQDLSLAHSLSIINQYERDIECFEEQINNLRVHPFKGMLINTLRSKIKSRLKKIKVLQDLNG
jgi:hypothetical protein